jgi:glycosyltransferase involved in cell wall biosynthesis
MTPRLKVLAVAYACSPLRGSEAGVGWGWARALAEHHDLWVITAEHWRQEIEPAVTQEPGLNDHLRFIYVPRRWQGAVSVLEKFWPPTYLATYKHQWQREAFKAAQKLHCGIGFDLVHQITYVGFRVPGWWWRLGIPFVWGPIGGLEQTPWRLLPAMGLRGAAHFACRNLWNDFDRRLAPGPREAFRRAAVVIAATEGIQREIHRFYGRDSVVIPEVGLPPQTAVCPQPRAPKEPLKLIWSGLHIPRKALPVLFSAVRRLPERINWTLEILGSGPCTGRWRRKCRGLRLEARCLWRGQVHRDLALERMRASHVLVISSLYELTSSVTVEALACGLPVICPDLYGFRDAVPPECGIRVPARSAKDLGEGIAQAIIRLHDNEEVRRRMAEAALRQSRSYDWLHKVEAISKLYENALSHNAREVTLDV